MQTVSTHCPNTEWMGCNEDSTSRAHIAAATYASPVQTSEAQYMSLQQTAFALCQLLGDTTC